MVCTRIIGYLSEMWLLGFKVGQQLQLVVDIVSGGSGSWIKVVARNPRALAVNSQGGAQFGQKNIIDQVLLSLFSVPVVQLSSQVKEFVLCARQNQVLFAPPTVTFVFACGVTKNIRERLVKRGVEVKGELVPITQT